MFTSSCSNFALWQLQSEAESVNPEDLNSLMACKMAAVNRTRLNNKRREMQDIYSMVGETTLNVRGSWEISTLKILFLLLSVGKPDSPASKQNHL